MYFLGSAGGGCGNQEKRQKPVLTEEVPKITVERVVADTSGQKKIPEPNGGCAN